jgi:hypothetical protein
MTRPAKKNIVEALLARHGKTYAEELGIPISQGTPSPLFRWLCASILFSARISAEVAKNAAKALSDAGWTTPQKMADSTWAERTKILNESGYARYDESTSRMLGDDADLLLSEYAGDLRKLREKADHDPGAERKLLKEFKGLGDVGVDIFMREVQEVWDELYPFADKKALAAAEKLDLGRDAEALSSLVARKDFPRLIAALVRVDLAKAYDHVLAESSA